MKFSARATGGQTTKGAISGDKHRGFDRSRQGQGGVGPPLAVVMSSAGEIGPPNQGGPGPRVDGEGGTLQMPATSKATGIQTGTAGSGQL